MEKIRKYFGEFNMTWPRVILFAVITGVYTGVINMVPALKDTSFQDIAVFLDWWFLFAIFVITNCKKWQEASLKCFVFFLISQPLVYLVQVPFNSMGWSLFGYYRYWFIITLLTLPGAAIAFQVKRKDWLSVAVLSVATGYLAWASVYYMQMTIKRFPHHLLSSIFCFALALFFIFVLLDEKKHRIAALAVVAVALAACVSLVLINQMGGSTMGLSLDEGEWTCTVEDESIVSVEISDGNYAEITSKTSGYTLVDFEDANGTVRTYGVLVDGRNISVSEVN